MTSEPESETSVTAASSPTEVGNQAQDQQYHIDKHTIPYGAYHKIPDATRTPSGPTVEASSSTLPQTSNHSGGTNDDVSSATSIPCNEIGSSKCLPLTLAPEVLHTSLEDLVYPESPRADDKNSDQELLTEQSHTDQKGKGKARAKDEIMPVNPSCGPAEPTHDFTFLSIILHPVEDWVVHTKYILGMYADRQVPLPLNRRVHISLNEPSQFITGALQLLVNRDHPKDAHSDPSRRLGPQLLENFVDIRHWAQEYFRTRHKMQNVEGDVPILLTAITNIFYEAHIQLIDRLVDVAVENMHFCGQAMLSVDHFAFGFDFQMSHDLPFLSETSSRIRDSLVIHTKPHGDATASSQATAPETMVTKSGRQVKMTKKAQELTHQNQIVEKKQTAPVTKKSKKKNKKSVPAALVPIIASEVAENQTSTKKTPTCGARKCNANGIASTSGTVSAASMPEVPPSGVLLCTPSAAVCHTLNHGNKADLVSIPSHGSKDPTCGQIMTQSTMYLKDGTSTAESKSNVSLLPGPKQVGTAPLSNNEAEKLSQAQEDHNECAACSSTTLSKPLLPQASYRLLPVPSGSWPSAQSPSSVFQFQFKSVRPDATHIDDLTRSVVDSAGPVESTSDLSSAVGGVTAPMKSGQSSTDALLAPSHTRTCKSLGLQADDRNETLEVTLPSLVNQVKHKGDYSATQAVAPGSVSRAKLNDPGVDGDKRTGLKICIPPLRAGGISGVLESPSQPSTSLSSTSSRRGGAPRARRGRGWSGSRGGERIGWNPAPPYDLRPMTPAPQKNLISQTALLPIGDVADDVSSYSIGSLDMAQQGRCGDAPRSPMTVSSSRTQEVGGHPMRDKNSGHMALHQGKKRKLDGSEG